MDGGTQLVLELPPESSQLAITLPGSGQRWFLRLATSEPHAELDALVAQGRRGEYQAAFDALTALRRGASSREFGPIDAAIGRMSLALGDFDRAEVAFKASIAAAESEGRVADVVLDGAALVWALVHLRQRYTDARAILAKMSAFSRLYPEGEAWLLYHEALLAEDTIDIRSALMKYRQAERQALRLGLTRLANDSSMEIARVLIRIGRAEEAAQTLRKLMNQPTEPCARATRALNLAWAETESAVQNPFRGLAPDRSAAVEEAQQATQACPDPHRRTMAAIYSLELAITTGRDDLPARSLVKQLESQTVDGDVLRSSHSAEVVGRWYLLNRNPARALAAFQSALPRLRAVGLVDEIFRANVGAGRALLALGRRKEAIANLKEAQQVLEGMMRGIPVAEGRGTFLSTHDQGVRFLISALLESGEQRAALRVARWTRAFELASATRLDRLAQLPPAARHQWDEALGRYQRIRSELERLAGSDWTLTRGELVQRRSERASRAEDARVALDEAYRSLVQNVGPADPVLRGPVDGEMYLVFAPGAAGWLGFGATSTSLKVQSMDAGSFSGSENLTQILDYFGHQLQAASRLRLFPNGLADEVDWQSVRWRGKPLLDHVEVEYALDLGASSGSRRDDGALAMALVVSNPGGDLPAATDEGRVVREALAGWQITGLDGVEASRRSVLHALSQSSLFHFAGHTSALPSAGFSNGFLLNGGERIEIGDILAAPTVPRLVVLSACAAANSSEQSQSIMGLAQAFVAAGSIAAIAPVRPIADNEARQFATAFYSNANDPSTRGDLQRPDPEMLNSVRARFRRAELAALSATGRGEGFRLLVQ